MATAVCGDIQVDVNWIRDPAGVTVKKADAEVALKPAAVTMLAENVVMIEKALAELSVKNLKIGAEEVGTAVEDAIVAIAAVAGYETVKEMGTAFVESLAKSAAESLSEET